VNQGRKLKRKNRKQKAEMNRGRLSAFLAFTFSGFGCAPFAFYAANNKNDGQPVVHPPSWTALTW
jgi:hypothetical protein